MADVEKVAPSSEETPKVDVETKNGDHAEGENGSTKVDVSGAKEEKGEDTEKNGNGTKEEDKDAKNSGDVKEKNGDHKDETNGHSNGDGKEATKRKAEDEVDSSKEEPIPVSAEKIAKLKEAEQPNVTEEASA